MEKKSGLKRQKKMSSALLSLSRSVQELTEENRTLKEDLDRVLSDSPTVSRTKGTFQSRLGCGAALGRHGPPRRQGRLPWPQTCLPLGHATLKRAELSEHLLGAETVVSRSTQTSLVEVTPCQGGREADRSDTGQVVTVLGGKIKEEGGRVCAASCAPVSRVVREAH